MHSLLTHTVETRAETTKTRHLVNTCEMKTLRMIQDKILRDKIPNNTIKEMCHLIMLRTKLLQQHISRMSGTRLAWRTIKTQLIMSKRIRKKKSYTMDKALNFQTGICLKNGLSEKQKENNSYLKFLWFKKKNCNCHYVFSLYFCEMILYGNMTMFFF